MPLSARMKSTHGSGLPIPTLSQVAAPVLSPSSDVFLVDGTTAITRFSSTNAIRPGRIITLIGINATGPAFTDTAVASRANGTISLSAALTLALGTTVSLVQYTDGSWWETARAANG